MAKTASKAKPSEKLVKGRCLCGGVEIAFVYPAFWAWHDHGAPSRTAHGAVYATYLGCWRKNIRILKGEALIARFEDTKTNTVRSFCSRCGTPLIYDRKRSKHMVNLPRALFATRTGREPRYHLNIAEQVDWLYTGAPLAPLKGYPGVVWERPKAKKRKVRDDPFDEVFDSAFRSTAKPAEDS
ncbi:MAG TPA: GFA family protein [Rhizomicrobium sp.]|nr:GFA family protein [Rhizomicrobium sp.]